LSCYGQISPAHVSRPSENWAEIICTYHIDIPMVSIEILQFSDAYLERRFGDVFRLKRHRVAFSLQGSVFGRQQHRQDPGRQ